MPQQAGLTAGAASLLGAWLGVDGWGTLDAYNLGDAGTALAACVPLVRLQ